MPAPPALPRILIGGMLAAIGNPRIMLQLWGEGMTDPEVGELASGVVQRLRATSRTTSQWVHRARRSGTRHDAQRTAPRPTRPTSSPSSRCRCSSPPSQGYVIQLCLLSDFDGEAYLAAVEKYLPR